LLLHLGRVARAGRELEVALEVLERLRPVAEPLVDEPEAAMGRRIAAVLRQRRLVLLLRLGEVAVEEELGAIAVELVGARGGWRRFARFLLLRLLLRLVLFLLLAGDRRGD